MLYRSSYGIIECIVVLLVVIVRSFEEATGCANFIEAVAFSSRGSRNGLCVDCGLNEYWMDHVGDSDFAVDGCRAFVMSSIGDMFDDVIDGLQDELLHWHQLAQRLLLLMLMLAQSLLSLSCFVDRFDGVSC